MVTACGSMFHTARSQGSSVAIAGALAKMDVAGFRAEM